MYFADSTRLIRVKLAGAVTTNQLPVTGTYLDITVSGFSVSAATPIHTVTNSTTVVTIVPSPSAGTVSVLQSLAINNADTAAATVTVEAYDSTNARTIAKDTLAVGDTLIYDGAGWYVLDSNGQKKHVFSDTSIYALLAGRGGGQTLNGGTGASDNLTLRSTTNASKGSVLIGDDNSTVTISTTGTITLGASAAVVQVGGGATAATLRFMEPSGSGTNYMEFKAQAMAGNVTMIWPAADGTAYRKLTTDGAGNFSYQQSLVQFAKTLYVTAGTGTTTLPYDDTIPQNTEGDEYFTVAITPKNTANRLIIRAWAFAGNSASNNITMALFQDSTAGALAAATCRPTALNIVMGLALAHEMAAGTTSSTTFKIRVGGQTAGTTTMNGTGGARVLGGVLQSGIIVEEYSA